MGFLRKKFKQIKKKVKKLLGGKFGKILGGIGLAMMFWGGAKALFGGKGGWFDSFSSKLKDMNPFASDSVVGSAEKLINTETVGAGGGFGVETGTLVTGQGGAGAVVSPPTVPKLKLTDTPFSDLGAVDKIKKVGVETKDFLLPKGSMDTFVPDVVKTVGTNLALQAVQGEPVDEGGYGRVVSFDAFEPAQDAMLRQVQSQIPNLQATNFNQLNQSLYYGTLSPHYIAEQAREMGLASQIPKS